jgi:hypothetical protein
MSTRLAWYLEMCQTCVILTFHSRIHENIVGFLRLQMEDHNVMFTGFSTMLYACNTFVTLCLTHKKKGETLVIVTFLKLRCAMVEFSIFCDLNWIRQDILYAMPYICWNVNSLPRLFVYTFGCLIGVGLECHWIHRKCKAGIQLVSQCLFFSLARDSDQQQLIGIRAGNWEGLTYPIINA